MKLPHRRQFLHLAAGATALPALPHIARAQGYPARPVTIVVPLAAGGQTDVTTRIIAEYMSRVLGQQFIVENVIGAGGTTGSTRVMRARPDGYTILMGTIGTHAFAGSFYPNLAYKPDADFEPIGTVLEVASLIVARKDFPPKDLNEFIGYAKANAEKLNVAHGGFGGILFTHSLMLHAVLGIKPIMVPFTGAAPALNALSGGQIDYMLNGVDVAQQVQAGTVKAYAIAAPERHPALPNLPTTIEAGLPEFLALSWFGLFAPKGVPRPILDKLTDALDRALDDDSVRKRLVDIGGNIPAKARRGLQPLAALVKSEIARWTPIIKAANVKAE